MHQLNNFAEDLQYDAKEDKFFIDELKALLSEKESECEQYKKILVDNLKTVSLSISESLKQVNLAVKKPLKDIEGSGESFKNLEILSISYHRNAPIQAFRKTPLPSIPRFT